MRGDAVRLLTAHRSKGLEWRLVVVVHVQEERVAGPAPPRLAAAGRSASAAATCSRRCPTQAMLAEERRLFYVACTRARERLLVTAVASPEDDGEQPSRFLEELAADRSHLQGRPARPLSLAGLVAELRRTVADPEGSDGAAPRGRAPACRAGHRQPTGTARWPRPRTRAAGGACAAAASRRGPSVTPSSR